ncbi:MULTISPECIES: ABC transporter ATP-binding protein [unclassified Mesorhizobium]|jgi:ABC-type taurine transport system ATPase subunit|uniref:ABC transporter ATP-binding protein n=1 Tax=unclassified Mesorhizobium TaxID=325217 RepID=UPI000960EBBA|nr:MULTISPECIES: ABC transporter ATP-binding protein [unclassified Mesorhizobium]MBN9254188.1 ABC transporter ATP-binding protein [Mesorhizobium sp.]MBN9275643.1 ABC transporter ATP-binding protein [Mesorhizobium sp.]OJX71051.1 MAG: hypothetical protein BGO93_17290 [Mesorhizobium sp. 65-26]
MKLSDVTVSYQLKAGPLIALDNVNLDVSEGSFVSLIGPSGCGKSTILNLMAGYIKPTRGQVLMMGKPVEGPGPDRMVVHQSSSALLPWLSVADNVGLGLRAKGVPKAKRKEIVRNYLDLVSLGGFGDHPIYHISGGMQQRVALARALATEAPVVLLDEPLGAIDALQREVMQDLLLDIWNRTRRTFVLVTHSVEEAVYLSTDIVVMSARPGRVLRRSSVSFGAQAVAEGSSKVKAEQPFVTAQSELMNQLIHG